MDALGSVELTWRLVVYHLYTKIYLDLEVEGEWKWTDDTEFNFTR